MANGPTGSEVLPTAASSRITSRAAAPPRMHTEIQPGEPTQASWLTHSWQGCDRTVMVTEGLGTHMIFSVENNHDGRIYRVQASDAKCFVCVTTALGGGTQEEARAPGAESLAPSHGGQIPQCRATGVPSTPASPQAPGRHLAKGREAPHDSRTPSQVCACG